MFSRENIKIIKETIKDFFEKSTFDPKRIDVSVNEKVVTVNLEVEDPQVLIGERGQTLNEIQYLIKAVLRKKLAFSGFSDFFYVNLDINDYKQRKSEYLRETARSAISEVVLSKKEKILPPMSAYERRIIHMELAGREDVISESRGENPDRSVVIKPRLE